VIGSAARPAWQRGSLSATELALLSGEQAPQPPEPQVVEPAEPVAPATEELLPSEPVATELMVAEQTDEPLNEPEAPGPESAPEPTEPSEPAESTEAAESNPDPSPPDTPATPEPAAIPGATDTSERLTPQTSLTGSARNQVNADGSLQQPPRRGPLDGLREKLGG
jgi:hypothetical protein